MGRGAGWRAVLGTRLPDEPTTGRPVLPWWPFLVIGAGSQAFSIGVVVGGGVGWASLGPATAGALAAVLARARPAPAAVLVGASVLAAGVLAASGTAQTAPPWFLNIIGPHLAVAFAVAVALSGRPAAVLLGGVLLCGVSTPIPHPSVLLGWVAAVLLAATLGARRRDRLLRTRAMLDAAGVRRVREEHDRLARELHDVVAHQLSELAVRAASAPHRLTGVGAAARAEFTELGGLARGALGEMRTLLGVLRGDPGAERVPLPGLADLPQLADSARRAGIEVRVECAGSDDLPAATGLSAYRIVQEALSNVTRHAAGAAATVRVRPAGEVLRIEIENGAPVATAPAATVPAAPGAGLGLSGMRERARLLGGRLSAGPVAGGGFLVRAELPLEQLR